MVANHSPKTLPLALALIPVSADENNAGESDVPVNFGGVTFFPEDYVYADLTGIILSQEPLDLEEIEDVVVP